MTMTDPHTPQPAAGDAETTSGPSTAASAETGTADTARSIATQPVATQPVATQPVAAEPIAAEPVDVLRNRRFDIIVALAIVCIVAVTLLGVLLGRNSRPAPAVAYMVVADGIQNIWLSSVTPDSQPRQLTFSEDGVFNFGVRSDGREIVYAERGDAMGLHNLYTLDLRSGETTLLLDCEAQMADCTTPVYRPQGDAVAYERVGISSAGAGAMRVWLLDLRDLSHPTTQLADDQIPGYGPQWSADGNTVAFYSSDIANSGIMILDFIPSDADNQRKVKFIPSGYGTVGALSPSAQQHIYPQLQQRDNGFYASLIMADLVTLDTQPLTDPAEPIDDTSAVWSPDNQHVVVERRYLDSRNTIGNQLYLLDTISDTIEPLVVDGRYSNGFVQFSADGSQFALQRLLLRDDSGNPVTSATTEIWLYDMASGNLTRLADDGYFPRWIETQ